MAEFVNYILDAERLRGKSHRVDIHMGDATLYAALNSLQNPSNRVFVLDKNGEPARKLINELSSGIPVFSFLETDRQGQRDYASFVYKVLDDPYWRQTMQEEYTKLWEKASGNMGNLTFVEAPIKQALIDFESPVHLADNVTYHFPSPAFDPRFDAFRLAAHVLRPNGVFTVTTENSNLMEEFRQLGGKFVLTSGRVNRGSRPFVSAYDFAWGKDGHYQVQIKNKDGKLPYYINNLMNTFTFKAMSFLGMVR